MPEIEEESKKLKMLRINGTIHDKVAEIKEETGIPIVTFVQNAILEKIKRDFPGK